MLNSKNAREDATMRAVLGDSLFDAISRPHEGIENLTDKLNKVAGEIGEEAVALADIDPLLFQHQRQQLTAYLSSLRPGHRIALLTALIFDGYNEGGIAQPLTDIAVVGLLRELNEKVAADTGIPVEAFLTASAERLLKGVAEVRLGFDEA